LVEKIRKNAKKIIEYEEYKMKDAEIVIVSYGISARIAYQAVDWARDKGIKAGLLKLITVWPFPEEKIKRLSKKVKALITVEINFGQIFFEVERCAKGNCLCLLVSHAGGTTHKPEDVLSVIEEAIK